MMLASLRHVCSLHASYTDENTHILKHTPSILSQMYVCVCVCVCVAVCVCVHVCVRESEKLPTFRAHKTLLGFCLPRPMGTLLIAMEMLPGSFPFLYDSSRSCDS